MTPEKLLSHQNVSSRSSNLQACSHVDVGPDSWITHMQKQILFKWNLDFSLVYIESIELIVLRNVTF